MAFDRTITKLAEDSALNAHYIRCGDELVCINEMSFIKGEYLDAPHVVIKDMLLRLQTFAKGDCPLGDTIDLYFLRKRNWLLKDEKKRKECREKIINYLKKYMSKNVQDTIDQAKKIEEFFYRQEDSEDDYLNGKMFNNIEKYLKDFNILVELTHVQGKKTKIHSAKTSVTEFEAFNIDEADFANLAIVLKHQFQVGAFLYVLDGRGDNAYHQASIVSFSDTCPYKCTIKWTSGYNDEIYLHPDVIKMVTKKRNR
jgi:hypothetical protein